MSERRPRERGVVETLLDAYRRGYFPMGLHLPWDPPGKSHIEWFSPDPRGVMPLTEAEGFHVPARLRTRMRTAGFTLRVDSDFGGVIRQCAQRREDPSDPTDHGSWINGTIIAWYERLHRAGHAHSVEAWLRDPRTGAEALAGGLYGVAIGSAFFGESMFHLPRRRRPDGSRDPLDGTDAGKFCLVRLARALASAGFTLFDTQMATKHTARFGAREIPRREYLERLDLAVNGEDRWEQADATLMNADHDA